MSEPPRTLAERTADVRAALAREVDCWLATADEAGRPYLVPLSFYWDGAALVLATEASSRTGRNLARGVPVRLGLGATRDVVIVDGEVEAWPAGEVPDDVADAYSAHAGWDPTTSDGNAFFRVRPTRIQAWRQANELAGRDVVRDGRWLADTP